MVQRQMNEEEIKKDRLRFTKNKLSADLILLAIAANALYFVSVYSSDVGSYYYTLSIGASIVYNLLFMLLAFLSSEGVKGYKMGYSFVSILLGVLQIMRICILPLKAHRTPNPLADGVSASVMSDGQFRYIAVCLCVSALLLVGAGIIGIMKTTTLKHYQAELDDSNHERNKL